MIYIILETDADVHSDAPCGQKGYVTDEDEAKRIVAKLNEENPEPEYYFFRYSSLPLYEEK